MSASSGTSSGEESEAGGISGTQGLELKEALGESEDAQYSECLKICCRWASPFREGKGSHADGQAKNRGLIENPVRSVRRSRVMESEGGAVVFPDTDSRNTRPSPSFSLKLKGQRTKWWSDRDVQGVKLSCNWP
ncbi:hypothetical protein B0H17DRAFT_1131005 [Mycena rosella]|uniref:Ephrin RBD domain-containing protein n=1 Tax=Mycena rosella TaxID=1033263 RepID=A0AAD7DNT8_MYCRO|nr:hypothetical protein B0H17DRAFT_1131005 [Mycena rosella]